jgi:hypothetical protein
MEDRERDNGAATKYRMLLWRETYFRRESTCRLRTPALAECLGRQQTVDTVDGGAEAQHRYRHIESLKSHGEYLRKWTPPQCQRKVPSIEFHLPMNHSRPPSETISR